MVRGSCFAISGLAAGIAGVLLASRTQSAAANLGSGMELTAISAAVVGGTSILGGEGAIWRAVLGTLLLAIIGNGFNLLNIDTTYQQIVAGRPDPARRRRRPAGPPPLSYSPRSQRSAASATTDAVCSSESMSTHSSAPCRPPASGP